MIADFSDAEGDRIDLSAIDANTTLAGDQAFTSIGAASFTGGAGEVRAVVQGDGNTHVFGSAARSNPNSEIVLTGSLTLQSTDFVL